MGFGREDRDAATLFGGPAAAGAAGLRARPAEPGADRRPVRGGRDDAVPVAAAGAKRRPPGGEAAAGRPGAATGRRGPGRAARLGGGDERLDAGEYAECLAERTGARASTPTVCRALRKLGLVRKKPSARPSRSGPTSSPGARHGAPIWPRSTQLGSSSSTRAGSTPA